MSTSTSPSNAEKVRENRLRRMAERQGYRLMKVRRRDRRALDFGGWQLGIGESRPGVFTAMSAVLTLDEVERILTTGHLS